MHILAFIILFIFGSIGAAFKGDWSGIEAIGKFLFLRYYYIRYIVLIRLYKLITTK